MADSLEMARLAFGDPGFFDFLAPLAQPFKAVAPILSTAASFIPIAGPLISKGIDFAAGMIGEDQNGDDMANLNDGEADDDNA